MTAALIRHDHVTRHEAGALGRGAREHLDD
jgi:hypothetical protein